MRFIGRKDLWFWYSEIRKLYKLSVRNALLMLIRSGSTWCIDSSSILRFRIEMIDFDPFIKREIFGSFSGLCQWSPSSLLYIQFSPWSLSLPIQPQSYLFIIFSCDADQGYCCRSNVQTFKFQSPKKTSYATVVIQCGGGSDMSLRIPWMIRKQWKEFVSEQIKNGE